MRITFVAIAVLGLAACASNSREMAAPEVAATVTTHAFVDDSAVQDQVGYRIGPSDQLRITVFRVPDLSFAEISVDASGRLELPLVGSVRAAGSTPGELSREIERLLQARYLRDPQVTVTVTEAASQKVTVDGAVTKPGVYEMRGRTSLMQAVAMAEGPTRTAQLESVAVFRNVDDRRTVAVFDLRAIRNGSLADPIILGDDIIVVDTNTLSANMREILAALPGLAAFAYF